MRQILLCKQCKRAHQQNSKGFVSELFQSLYWGKIDLGLLDVCTCRFFLYVPLPSCGVCKTERSVGALLGPELEWLCPSCSSLYTKIIYRFYTGRVTIRHFGTIIRVYSRLLVPLFLVLSASKYSQNIPGIISAGSDTCLLPRKISRAFSFSIRRGGWIRCKEV